MDQPAKPATLGDVLYADGAKARESEQDWARLMRAIAGGDQMALHAIYERASRPVYTLIMRLVANRETAEELTLDVFHDVWRRASGYDAVNGTVLGWIMNQARSRAIDRIRFDQRKKRVAPNADVVPADEPLGAPEVLAARQQNGALRAALSDLAPGERQAIEAAFFSGLTHAEAAARLDQPLGTVKTRIRSGLLKLRRSLRASKEQG